MCHLTKCYNSLEKEYVLIYEIPKEQVICTVTLVIEMFKILFCKGTITLFQDILIIINYFTFYMSVHVNIFHAIRSTLFEGNNISEIYGIVLRKVACINIKLDTSETFLVLSEEPVPSLLPYSPRNVGGEGLDVSQRDIS